METFFLREKYNLKDNFPIPFGETIIISDDMNEINHIKKSKRKKKGDLVDLIDGLGNRYRAKILDISSKKSITFSVVEDLSSKNDVDYNNSIDLTIAVSMLNNSNKLKLLIEKLTEIGVTNFQPFISERSSFLGKKMPDLENITISALKQCKGNVLIKIEPLLSFDDLLGKNIKPDNAVVDKYYCHFDGDDFIFPQSILDSGIKKNIIILIGPEGGFSETEINKMKDQKYKSIKLNKRVLRAETAAIVAASRVLI